jgi:hypothetical protein
MTRALAAALVATMLVATTPTPAHAEESTESQWYGWQLLLTDAVMLAASVAIQPLFVVGYLLDGVLVHAAHGNAAGAAGSIGLRAALPAAGAAIGGAMCDEAETSGGFFSPCFGPIVEGLLGGMLLALVTDWTLFSWTREPEDPAGSPYGPYGFTIRPRVALAGRGVEVGADVRF